MLRHFSLFKVAAIIKKIPLQSRLNYLGFCNYLGLHKAENKIDMLFADHNIIFI
jgi:hypothetical protein